jgi:integrase/recombinase XerD
MAPRKPKKLPKTLTREEADALLAQPNLATPTGLRDRAMLELMYRAGLRVTETCQLHLRDVRWREAELHLRPEITKGQKEAVLPLGDRVLDWLERWKPIRRGYADGPWLFVQVRSGSGAGGPLDRRDVYKMIGRRAARAGIRHVSPHVLRHTFASELMRDEFTLEEVRRLMRHESVRTTGIYLEVHDVHLSERLRRRG